MAELKEVTEVAEPVAEAVEKAVQEIPASAVRTPVAAIGIAVGIASGLAIGYFVARRRLEAKYEKIAEDEISQMRDHFRKRVVAKEAKPELSDIGRLKYNSDIPEQVIPEEIREKLDTKPLVDEWDWEVEKAQRVPHIPYVIHVDERHERDYQEVTLTYYAGDDILCDEQDKPIENLDQVMGAENLDKFGHGSGDKYVVYVRNETLELDLEICWSDKHYAEEVHGFSHSDEPRRRRKVKWDE
jgi:hypothetical protein